MFQTEKPIKENELMLLGQQSSSMVLSQNDACDSSAVATTELNKRVHDLLAIEENGGLDIRSTIQTDITKKLNNVENKLSQEEEKDNENYLRAAKSCNNTTTQFD